MSPALGADGPGLVALPNDERARGAERRFGAWLPCVARHPSGRPWLLTNRPRSELGVAAAGQTAVALLGYSPANVTAVAERVEAGGIDAFALVRPVGSYHIVARIGDVLAARGSLSGLRRICHSQVDGVTVVSDRPDWLAWATGAGIDKSRVAAAMCLPAAPILVESTSLWQGVSIVPADHFLTVDRAVRVRRWWSPPEPVGALADGAVAVRQELSDAVAARCRDADLCSADLSGGLDSASLCFLLQRADATFFTVRVEDVDAGGDDGMWARVARDRLTEVEHLLLANECVPEPFAELTVAGTDPEEPAGGLRVRTRFGSLAELLVRRGSRVHLSGHGGDEVFSARPAYLRELAWRNPRVALTHLSGHRALRRWPVRAVLREFLDTRPYSRWWSDAADRLQTARSAPRTPPLGWGVPVRLPPWVTRDAAAAVRDLIRGAAMAAAPLAADRGQHAVVETIRHSGRVARHLDRVMRAAGLPLEVPYLDDRVVDAGLAVRLPERYTPWRYKPLLAEAVRGVVPDELLARNTKAFFDGELFSGLRRHRVELLALCDGAELERIGLIVTS